MQWLRTVAPLVWMVRAARKFRRMLGDLRGRLAAGCRTTSVRFRWYLRWPGSPVEAAFLAVGMKEQFLLAMTHRFEDAPGQGG
jgi:hypothetical protein